MSTLTIKSMKKNFSAPDETRPFNNGKVDVINLGDVTVARISLRPGWKWSKDLKPIAETSSCQSPHVQYVISGRLEVRMDDGSRLELKPGDLVHIPPGHDAWVVGSEPFVAIDLTGLKDYAKR
jgi:mannose-6-phosphate isomerase-like protein (cupin superfamily)